MNSEITSPPFPLSAEIVPALADQPESLTYSVAEAAHVLGVSQPTIYRLITRRMLRPLPCIRHKRLPKKQVQRLANGDTL
jgi:excisionase family DNA binding protein